MDNPEERLIKVFQTVFPHLTKEEARTASQSNIPAWDSIAAITLMNVMEEEFEIVMDFDRAAELGSFPEMLAYVNETARASL